MPDNDAIQKQIANLYPDLSPEERQEVEAALRSYLAVVQRIFEHVKDQNPRVLTELAERARLREGRESA